MPDINWLIVISIFFALLILYIGLSFTFLALSSKAGWKAVKATAIWQVIASGIFLTLQLYLGIKEPTLQFNPTPPVPQQSAILILSICNCAILIVNFYKYQNDENYTSFNESTLILGIMQVAICMSITSAFKNIIFPLQITANIIYLVLPALAIYEFSKTLSSSGKKINESNESNELNKQ